MSATEIIEEFERLPVPEQERVLDFFLRACREHRADQSKVRYASDADFDKAADKVLREHAELFQRLAQ